MNQLSKNETQNRIEDIIKDLKQRLQSDIDKRYKKTGNKLYLVDINSIEEDKIKNDVRFFINLSYALETLKNIQNNFCWLDEYFQELRKIETINEPTEVDIKKHTKNLTVYQSLYDGIIINFHKVFEKKDPRNTKYKKLDMDDYLKNICPLLKKSALLDFNKLINIRKTSTAHQDFEKAVNTIHSFFIIKNPNKSGKNFITYHNDQYNLEDLQLLELLIPDLLKGIKVEYDKLHQKLKKEINFDKIQKTSYGKISE